MKRFNYFVSPAERVFGRAIPATIPPHVRAPLVTLAGALLATALGYGVQTSRLRSADADAAALALQLSASEVAAARVHAVARDVERLRTLTQRIDAIRTSGDMRADELTMLGNGVPAGAWLTAIHIDRLGVGIEGRGTRLEVVGTTMAVLGRLPAYRGARLLRVHGEAARPGVVYALGLEPAR